MSPRTITAVSAAIAAVRSALGKIDRTLTADVILRREAEAILAGLAAAPVAVLIANDRARYVEVNAAATVLTGYTRSELLRMSVWDLTPEPKRSAGMAAWEGFLRNGEQSGAYPLRRKDGTVVHAAYFATAHVLPNLHLSALTTTLLIRGLTRKGNARIKTARDANMTERTR